MAVDAVAFDDELVDVCGVERVERLKREVVNDEQFDAQQFAHLEVVAVVEPAGSEPFEEPIAPFEVDCVAASNGRDDRGRWRGMSCRRRRGP